MKIDVKLYVTFLLEGSKIIKGKRRKKERMI